jgi:hypothetical protein
VEDWSDGEVPFRLMRFQVQGHLNFISVEFDEAGILLSYEEYMPFGLTAYQLPSSKAPKRFRFASKERDTESDFILFWAEILYALALEMGESRSDWDK